MSKRINPLSLEMIAYNTKSDFYKDMIMAVGKLRVDIKQHEKTLNRNKESEYGPVAAVIKKHTNIIVTDYIVPRSYGLSPAVLPPDLDRNNPILHPLKANIFKGQQLKEIAKDKKDGVFEGRIDYVNGKIYGDFTKAVSILIMPQAILEAKLFKDEEIAAMFLHEVGHIFSYFMYLSKITTTSHVLSQLTEELNKTDVESEKIILLEEANKALKVDTLDPNDLVKVKDGERITSVIVSEVVKQRFSYTNTPVFDFRTWEAMSDQYASRHGSSVALATGLDKFMRIYDHPAYWSTGKYVLVTLFSLPFLAIHVPLLIIFSSLAEPHDIYDKPIDRMSRIRRDIVSALKNKKLTKEQSKQLQDDLKSLDGIIGAMRDREDIFSAAWRLINIKMNRDRKQTAYLNDLEIMANNDLFVKANRLKHL